MFDTILLPVAADYTMSPSKLIVSSLLNLDLITKREEGDLKKMNTVEGRNIQVDVIDLLESQASSNGRYIPTNDAIEMLCILT